jgi:hypothetical protein
VSVVINEYSVIRHSFSFFEVGDTISLWKFWNEYPNQELSTWAQLVDLSERIATQLAKIAAGPKHQVADWPSDG